MRPLTKHALAAGFAAALAAGTLAAAGTTEARPSFSLSLPGVGVYIDNGPGYYGRGYYGPGPYARSYGYGYGYGAPGPYDGYNGYYDDDGWRHRRNWRHWRRKNDPCPDYFNGCGR